MKKYFTLIVFALTSIIAHSQCSVSIASSNVNCYQAANGIMTANPTSGTGPFSFLWTPGGQTTQTVYGVTPGTYTVTVTDAVSCVSSASVTITQPSSSPYTVIMSTTDASCTCNGSANILAGGGTPPYSYS